MSFTKSLSAAELYAIEGEGLVEGSAAFSARWSLKDYESELSSEQSLLFVPELEGKGEAWGFVLLRKILSDEFEIMNLAVRLKGKGLGRKLMHELLNALPSYTRILLELRASNLAALRLYESCGFEVLGRRKAYYKNGEDAVLMELQSKGPQTP